MGKTVALLGTLDTKGEEYAFVAEVIRGLGYRVILIDVGTGAAPGVVPDIDRDEVLGCLPEKERGGFADRGTAVAAMSRAAPLLLRRLVEEEEVQGVMALGGSGGTAIGTAAMRALPLGFPKLMISTMAAGQTAGYVGVSDLVMMPSVVDVAGLNQISRRVFTQGAHALCGMLEAPETVEEEGRPLVVASMFGNTTACVQAAKAILEGAGYEVLVFHATGVGGRAMEHVIGSGRVAGVLDLTTTEWADEWVGGVLGAGETRLEAAAAGGVPAVVAPGCLDMVNFGARETVPQRFRGRLFYEHNPQVTLMRTNVEESAALGRILAEKLNASRGAVTVFLPLRGLSALGAPGGEFEDKAADAALFRALKEGLREDIALREVDMEINDEGFARACAEELMGLMGAKVRGSGA